MNNTISIYGAGGTGINLVRPFIGEREEGISCFGIDTSKSNVKSYMSVFNDHNFYHLDGLDGSGKKRDTNVEAISDATRDILMNFKPSDFNVVIFSASGGSGSVIGPLLVKEMLLDRRKVIAVVVGSSESRIASYNTFKTIKSLQAVSKQTKSPLIVSYQDNHATGRSEVNRAVKSIVQCLTFLGSGEIGELDSEDLYNWLYYPRVTDLNPSVALLDIFSKASDVNTHPIATISIFKDEDSIVALPDMAEYHCEGFDENLEEVRGVKEIHFAISTHELSVLMDTLSERLAKTDEQSRARRSKDVVLGEGDEVDESGLVL